MDYTAILDHIKEDRKTVVNRLASTEVSNCIEMLEDDAAPMRFDLILYDLFTTNMKPLERWEFMDGVSMWFLNKHKPLPKKVYAHLEKHLLDGKPQSRTGKSLHRDIMFLYMVNELVDHYGLTPQGGYASSRSACHVVAKYNHISYEVVKSVWLKFEETRGRYKY